MFGQYELFDPPPSCYDRMAQFPTVAVPCKINKQFERLVGNPLNSDMFVFIATNGERVPAHKFAVGTATPTLKRLIFGQLTTEPDDSKPLPVLSRHLLETFEGKPMLILNHLAPEQCHQLLDYIYTDTCQLTADIALAFLLHLFPVFGEIPDLRRLCIDHLMNYMRDGQVMTVYRTITDRKEDINLRRACVLKIQRMTDVLCTAVSTQVGDNLFQAPITSLDSVLLRHSRKRDDGDFVLFHGLLRWARAELSLRGVRYDTPDERRRYQFKMRAMCDGRLELLRLCQLSLPQFRLCMAEVESPSVGNCGYGPGFFTVPELRVMMKRCQVADRMLTLENERENGLESTRIDEPGLPLREQMWRQMDKELLLHEASVSLARLLTLGLGGNGRWDYHVGALIQFRVRDRAAAGRRFVVLGGLQCDVPVDLVRSVQLLRDGQEPVGGLEVGEGFRYHCNEFPVDESRLWLTRPLQLLPDVLYRLVVTADKSVELQFASKRRINKDHLDELDGPFEVDGTRLTTLRGERTVDTCNLNVTSLFYDYHYV